MAWTLSKGFNFRATSAYVTDGTNETYSIGEAYPTTRIVNGESVTFGWESGPGASTRDRSTAAGNAPELSGIVFNSQPLGTDYTFRVDLPAAGTYKINLALGDATSNNFGNCRIEDTTTVLTSIGNDSTTINAGTFLDATGVLRTSGSDWHANNAQYSATFATTICRVVVLGGSVASSVISHFRLTPASGAKIFTYTGTGGVLLAGAGTKSGIVVRSPAGGLAFGGVGQKNNAHTYSPAGGLTFSGTRTSSVARAPNPSGGLSFGGTATVSGQTHGIYSYTMTGGMTFSGTSTKQAARSVAPSGGALFGGSGSYSFNPPPGAGLIGAARRLFNPLKRNR